MVVEDHHVVHIIHLFMLVDLELVCGIVPRFMDFNESPIEESDKTLDCYSWPNLVSYPITMQTLLKNFTWAWMVRTTSFTSS
jgi:hypothetical protein